MLTLLVTAIASGLFGDRLSAGGWAKQNSAKTSGWKFSDEEGGEWRRVVEVRPAGGGVFTISLKVGRAGGDR